MDAFDVSPLCPAPRELQLDEIAFQESALRVRLRARRRFVSCPACGHATSRVHSRYARTLTDLPWHGLRVRLVLEVRRFFCDVPGCSRRILPSGFPSPPRRTVAVRSVRAQRSMRLRTRSVAALVRVSPQRSASQSDRVRCCIT